MLLGRDQTFASRTFSLMARSWSRACNSVKLPQEIPMDSHVSPMTPNDEQHLKILSICNYVMGALNIFGGCFGFIYVVLGVLMLSGVFDTGNQGEEVPAFVGVIFIVAGLLTVLLAGAMGAAYIMAGRYLVQHRSRTFCFVVAVIECLGFPLGTILGVCTIVVLNRPAVRAAFEANS